MFVRNAMTSEIHFCHPHDSLKKITQMMRSGDCGAIPIVDKDQRPIGIVTDRDIALYAAAGDCKLSDIVASEIIKGQKISCCAEDDNIDDALRKMESRRIRRLLVTNHSGILVGILSLGDIAALTDVPEMPGDHISPIKTLNFVKAVSAHHRCAVAQLI